MQVNVKDTVSNNLKEELKRIYKLLGNRPHPNFKNKEEDVTDIEIESRLFKEQSDNWLQKLEDKEFITCDEKLLDEKSRIIREYCKIDSIFTYEIGEEYNFETLSNIENTIKEFRDVIYRIEDFDKDTLMAMIVMYDLILGIDVSFYKSLIKISKIENLNQELAYVIYGNFDFLYNCLKKDLEKEEDYEFSKKLNR